jgi:hypothetical protein
VRLQTQLVVRNSTGAIDPTHSVGPIDREQRGEH